MATPGASFLGSLARGGARVGFQVQCQWMGIDGFVWLRGIAEKVATKHGLAEDEVEQVFFNGPRYRFVESGYRRGEDVYAALGRTDAGRYVVVFFIHKVDKSARILSARAMVAKERRRYERK